MDQLLLCSDNRPFGREGEPADPQLCSTLQGRGVRLIGRNVAYLAGPFNLCLTTWRKAAWWRGRRIETLTTIKTLYSQSCQIHRSYTDVRFRPWTAATGSL